MKGSEPNYRVHRWIKFPGDVNSPGKKWLLSLLPKQREGVARQRGDSARRGCWQERGGGRGTRWPPVGRESDASVHFTAHYSLRTRAREEFIKRNGSLWEKLHSVRSALFYLPSNNWHLVTWNVQWRCFTLFKSTLKKFWQRKNIKKVRILILFSFTVCWKSRSSSTLTKQILFPYEYHDFTQTYIIYDVDRDLCSQSLSDEQLSANTIWR